MIFLFLVPFFALGFIVGFGLRWLKMFYRLRMLTVFRDRRANTRREICFGDGKFIMFVWVDDQLSDFWYESVDAETWTQKRLKGLLEHRKAA